jgi:hypothetical protein
MMDNIDEVTDKRMEALEEIEKDKRRVARAYNKKVKAKSFQVGDSVWKTILSIGSKSSKFGKWYLLTVLTTKFRPSKPQVREECTTSFMHIFYTNKVP